MAIDILVFELFSVKKLLSSYGLKRNFSYSFHNSIEITKKKKKNNESKQLNSIGLDKNKK